MQEKKVTVAGKDYNLPTPFHVLATQNPIDQEGTYPLPEAQLDRFLMNIKIGYPDLKAEKEILDLKKNSLNSINIIAEEISANVIENLTGEKLNSSSIKASVAEVSKDRMDKYL